MLWDHAGTTRHARTDTTSTSMIGAHYPSMAPHLQRRL